MAIEVKRMIAHVTSSRLASLLAVTGLLAACGSSSSTKSTAPATPSAGQAPAASGAVAIADFKFAPPTFLVKPGGTITFTNKDSAAHTATADDGSSFDSGTLQQGQGKAVTFSKAGTFKYHCVFHAFMTGTVTVRS